MVAPSLKLLWIAALVGVPLCAAAGFAGPQNIPCYLVLMALAVAAITDAWLALTRLEACVVEGPAEGGAYQLPEGRTATILLRLRGKPGGYEAAVQEQEGLTVTPAPKRVVVERDRAAEFRLDAFGLKRGRYRLAKCFVRAGSPLGLWHASGEKKLELSFRVYPDLRKEPGADLLFHRLRTGLRQQRAAGRGREFERLREYATGDSYEEIAWKATARRGRPVVRVFQVERTQDVYAIVDASRLSAREERLEHYVRASLLLALAVEAEGDNFGLAIFDDRMTKFVRAARGKQHFARCREALFDLAASRKTPDFGELFTELQLHVRRRALLLFLTNLDDALLAENFLSGVRLVAHKHVSAAGQIETPADRPIFSDAAVDLREMRERLAGHMRWATAMETRKSLERMGVRPCRLRQGAVATDLIAQYSEMKRQQVL